MRAWCAEVFKECITGVISKLEEVVEEEEDDETCALQPAHPVATACYLESAALSPVQLFQANAGWQRACLLGRCVEQMCGSDLDLCNELDDESVVPIVLDSDPDTQIAAALVELELELAKFEDDGELVTTTTNNGRNFFC